MSAIRSRAIQAATKESGLREVFAQDFLIGTALNTETFENGNAELLDLVAHEFNAITPANCMVNANAIGKASFTFTYGR